MKASEIAERIANAVWESTPGGASRLPSLATFYSSWCTTPMLKLRLERDRRNE
jgi:hypothetical protein